MNKPALLAAKALANKQTSAIPDFGFDTIQHNSICCPPSTIQDLSPIYDLLHLWCIRYSWLAFIYNLSTTSPYVQCLHSMLYTHIIPVLCLHWPSLCKLAVIHTHFTVFLSSTTSTGLAISSKTLLWTACHQQCLHNMPINLSRFYIMLAYDDVSVMHLV